MGRAYYISPFTPSAIHVLLVYSTLFDYISLDTLVCSCLGNLPIYLLFVPLLHQLVTRFQEGTALAMAFSLYV